MEEIGRRLLDSFRLGFSSERRGRSSEYRSRRLRSCGLTIMADHGSQLRVYRSTSREREERISSGSVQIDQEPCRKAITVSRTLADDAKIVGTESSIPTLIGSEIHLPSPIRTSGLGKHPRRNPTSTRQSHRDDRGLGSWGRAARQDNFPFSSHEVTYARGPAHVPSLQEGSEDRPRVSGKWFFFLSFLFKGALACHMHEHINR